MSWPTETIGATMNATPITIQGMVETYVRAVVMANDAAGIGLFKDFELCFWWFA